MNPLALLQARWTASEDASEKIALAQPVTFVGRGEGNDIVVECEGISGRHLEIHLSQGSATVRDLGSRNGTFLGGRRLAAGEGAGLPYGSTLNLGGCLELRLLPPEPGPSIAAPPHLYLVRQPQPGLIITQAGGLSQRLCLDRPRLILGRSSTCDVVLDHPLVSRQHAAIVAHSPGRYSIQDLGSRNGLFHQGQRIDVRFLSPGEWLSIGAGPPEAGVALQFEPAMSFVTRPERQPRPAPRDATMMAVPSSHGARLAVCPGCVAEDFGPRAGCLRCHTAWPAPGSKGERVLD